MKEAKVRTNFGDIRFTYNNIEELKDALQGLDEEINIISDATSKIISSEPRLPKPGYENAYRFLPNGRVELIYFPPIELRLAILALFAYHPESVTVMELENVTGIIDISKILGQTNNKKYFRRSNESYGLTLEGVQLVAEKIKPLLNFETEGKEK